MAFCWRSAAFSRAKSEGANQSHRKSAARTAKSERIQTASLRGVEEARTLMQRFGIREHQLIDGAYVDLLHPFKES